MIKSAISQYLYRKYSTSFSQGGEDVILAGLFSGRRNGFFVDVGAFHPYKLSNTYLLYKKGWSGINIDAAPGSMEVFKKMRPRDINLEAAISDVPEQMNYYYLGENNSMNTFSKEFLEQLDYQGKVQKTITIHMQRLDSIFDQYVGNREIDILTIDVEGMEIKVLNSNNWDKYRPNIILCESFEAMNDENNYDLEVKKYLYDKGYKVVCKTLNGIFFLRGDRTLNQYNHINF